MIIEAVHLNLLKYDYKRTILPLSITLARTFYSTTIFGIRGYKHHTSEKWQDNFYEILCVLDDLIKSGKIRHVGLSNENPWGIMRFLEEAKNDLPKMITVQNSYSLLNRQYEVGNA